MMLSFIIPAYNEEALIGATIDSVRAAAESAGEPFEVIVVNDGSTDATGRIARERGAHVIDVHKRHIAAVRNVGADHAQGEVLLFVDGDTVLPAATLRGALDALRGGAVGGGSAVRMDGKLGPLGWMYFELFLMCWRPLRLAAGCFIFARRADFHAVGGFDERYYASEEIWLSRALKKRGKFVIVREPVITSGRKARLYGATALFALGLRLLVQGPRAWRKREGMDLWYDGRREPAAGSNSAAE